MVMPDDLKDNKAALDLEKAADKILNTKEEKVKKPEASNVSVTQTSTKKGTKKVTLNPDKPKEIYYFYSLGCAWCKRLEPHLDDLIKEGYNIIKLDTGQEDNRNAKKELEAKFKFTCGTPALVNPENGKNICGYKEKDVLRKFVNGEDVPTPPRPNTPPPPPPKFDDNDDVSRWEKEYTKWRDENQHVKTIPATGLMLENLRKQFDRSRASVQDQSPQNLGTRLQAIESQLQRLMNHLGVK